MPTQKQNQVIAKINGLFPSFRIDSFPDLKQRMHLLVTNRENGKALRIRVQKSKNYVGTSSVKASFVPYLEYAGWWKFDPVDVFNTPADLWILVWLGVEEPTHCLLLSHAEMTRLLQEGCTEGDNGEKWFYWYMTTEGNSLAARPLGTQEIQEVLENTSALPPTLNLNPYVDAWQRHIGDVLR